MSDETAQPRQDEVEEPLPPAGEEFEGSVEALLPDADPLPPPVLCEHSPAESELEPAYSAEQRRDVRAVREALHCPDREHAMLTLAMAGRVCVGDLAKRAGIDQKALSRYLKDLRAFGLVEDQREGRFVFYQVIPGVVSYQRLDNRFSLTINRGSVSITHAADFLPRRAPGPAPASVSAPAAAPTTHVNS